MESRWMRRKTENGSEEKFYPITHKDAVVNLNETLLEKADVVDVVTTEFAEEEITGDAPELSPIAAQRIAELEARIAELKNSGGTGGSGGGSSSGVFVVNFTIDNSGYHSDKTFAEVEQACIENKLVRGILYLGEGAPQNHFQLTQYYPSEDVTLCNVSATSIDFTIMTMTLKADNSVEMGGITLSNS